MGNTIGEDVTVDAGPEMTQSSSPNAGHISLSDFASTSHTHPFSGSGTATVDITTGVGTAKVSGTTGSAS